MSVFTSDIFLEAFSSVINATPVYGKGLWIRRGSFINKAEGSAWNLFAKNPNVNEMIEISKRYRCWFLRFTAAAPLDDDRLGTPMPSPTMLTFPGFRPNKDVRWAIRKAEKSGFRVEPCHVAVIQPVLDQLWTKLGRGSPQRFYELLEKAGIGKALMARLGDQICSGLFYLVDELRIHYMYSLATDPNYKGSEVTSLLVWSFIRQAFEKGSPYVDLCGCLVPSIANFKHQFGSGIYYYPRYLIVLNPLWHLVKWKSTINKRSTEHLYNIRNWKDYVVPRANLKVSF
jgi:hypothetical protein